MIIKPGDQFVRIPYYYGLKEGNRVTVGYYDSQGFYVVNNKHKVVNLWATDFYHFSKIYHDIAVADNAKIKLSLYDSINFSVTMKKNLNYFGSVFGDEIKNVISNCSNKINVNIEEVSWLRRSSVLPTLFNAVQNCLRQKRKEDKNPIPLLLKK